MYLCVMSLVNGGLFIQYNVCTSWVCWGDIENSFDYSRLVNIEGLSESAETGRVLILGTKIVLAEGSFFA